jgi:hypothetical protein
MPKISKRPIKRVVNKIEAGSTDYFSSIICLKTYKYSNKAQERLMRMAKQVLI